MRASVWEVLDAGELKEGARAFLGLPENAPDAGMVNEPLANSRASRASETIEIFFLVEKNPEEVTAMHERLENINVRTGNQYARSMSSIGIRYMKMFDSSNGSHQFFPSQFARTRILN